MKVLPRAAVRRDAQAPDLADHQWAGHDWDMDQPSRQRASVIDADTGEYLLSGPFRQVRRRLDSPLSEEGTVPALPTLMWIGARLRVPAADAHP